MNEDLYKEISQSDITVIGYSFESEYLKDKLISKLNHIKIEELDPDFCFKRFLRDQKIGSVLSQNSLPEFIVVDLDLLKREKVGKRIYPIQAEVRGFLYKLRDALYSDRLTIDETFLLERPRVSTTKMIITTSLYTRPTDVGLNFSGGNEPIYIADLAMTINNGTIKIIKNRFGKDKISFNFSELQMTNS